MSKKFSFFASFSIMLLLVFLCSENAYAFSGDGTGIKEDPYLITEPEQLKEIEQSPSAYYQLENDLYMEGIDFEPIFRLEEGGVLDGNFFAIHDLTIIEPPDSPENSVGLFRVISGTIKNLKLENVHIVGGEITGAFGGEGENAHIINCQVSGYVEGKYMVGSIVGMAQGEGPEGDRIVLISHCSSSAELVTQTYQYGYCVGGLAGGFFGGRIAESYFDGSITLNPVRLSNQWMVSGGLVGFSDELLLINSYAIADFYDDSDTRPIAGGLIGGECNETTRIINSFYSGSINIYYENIDGINRGAIINNSYYDSDLNFWNYNPEYGRSASQMMRKDTYEQWDFVTIWNINEGSSLPYLRHDFYDAMWKDIADYTMPFVENVAVEEWDDGSLAISWDPIDGVDYYEVGIRDNKEDYIHYIRLEYSYEPNFVFENLYAYMDDFLRSEYNIFIKAYVNEHHGPVTTITYVRNPYTEGDGSKENPYIITSPKGLFGILSNTEAYYVLGNDIEMEGIYFYPIERFSGNLDGSGYAIRNLYIKTSISYTGLFGKLEKNGVVEDLSLLDVVISGGYATGAVAGENNGIIQNCVVTGRISSNGYYTGSFAGYHSGTLSKSYATAQVNSSSYNFGGLVGRQTGGVISKSYFAGKLESYNNNGVNIGGIAGSTSNLANIDNSFAITDVQGKKNIGGIVGEYSSGSFTIENSYFIGKLDAAESGTIYGLAPDGGKITNAYFSSDLTGLSLPEEQARTLAEMQQQSTYEGWDFNTIWEMDPASGFPRFIGVEVPGYDIFIVTGLKAAEITSDCILIEWDSIEGAASYEISVDGEIHTVTGAKLFMDDLTPKTDYTFKVRAFKDSIYSDWSNPLTVTTLERQLMAPENLRIIGVSATAITIGWDAAVNAEDYLVYIDEEDGVATDELQMTFDNLIPDTAYSFTIASRNEDGVSELSKALETRTAAIGMVQNFQAVANDRTSITLAWDELEGAVSYEIRFQDATISTENTQTVVEELWPGMEYSFSIRGVHGEKAGAWSVALSAATEDAVLEKPRNLQISDVSYDSITISWDGVAGGEEYIVRLGEQEWETKETSYTLAGLPADTSYTLHVRARNIYTQSSESSITAATQPLDAVTYIRLTAAGYTYVELSWAAVPGAQWYTVAYNDQELTVEDIAVKIEDLAPNTAYTFKIRGEQENSKGQWSASFSGATTTPVLIKPEGFKVAEKTTDTVTLQWTAVPEAENYEVRWEQGQTATEETNITITGLSPDRDYTFFVKAVNRYTESPEAAASERTEPIPAVEEIAVEDQGYSWISLSWKPVSYATKYSITYGEKTVASDIPAVTIENLAPDTMYSFKIRGEMDSSIGLWSEVFNARTGIPTLARPENLRLTEKTSDELTLSWDAVEEAESYIVHWGSESKEVTATETTIGGLTPYTEYTIQVQAKNQYITGEKSEALVVRTEPAPLEQVTGLELIGKTHNSLTLQWGPVPDATEYEITYNGETVVVEESPATIYGLSLGTSYTIQVRGRNTIALGAYASITVSTADTILEPPKNIQVSERTETTITLNWEKVETAEEYIIQYDEETLRTRETGITIGGLSSNTEYVFTIQSINQYALSEQSSPIRVKTQPKPFEAITGLEYTGRTNTAIALVWDEHPEATGYEVQFNEKTLRTTANSVTLANLAPNTEYTIAVRGMAEENTGEWSRSITVTTLKSAASIADEIKLNVAGANTYDVVFAGDDLMQLNGVFIIKYDAEVLELVDFATQTAKLDTSPGKVEGTNITIIRAGGGVIEFRVEQEVPKDKVWTGILTMARFKALKTRSTTIYMEQ